MQTTRALALIVAFTASWPLAVAGECVDPPRRPIRVSGALCGMAFDTVETLPGVDLYVTNQNQEVVAKVQADSKADFKFPPLPKGNYLLGATGCVGSYPIIELTSENAAICKRPLFLILEVSGDCRSYVTTRKPRY